VVLKTGAEPDSGGAEPHERDVAAVARPRDARAPCTRDDQSASGRIEAGMTVGYVEQRRGVFVLSPQPIEGLVGVLDQLLAPLAENPLVLAIGFGDGIVARVSVLGLDGLEPEREGRERGAKRDLESHRPSSALCCSSRETQGACQSARLS